MTESLPDPAIQRAIVRRAASLVRAIYFDHVPTPKDAAALVRERRALTRPEYHPAMSRAYSAFLALVHADYHRARRVILAALSA